ncbi:serine hydrolase domain-containing protein [Shewanella waksmanii]|uniref:serine hydrolase domain-containing protein n=1 Tax=Shewanella waksmanii TaxID=213783 RepID=UPI0037357B29
MNKAVFALAMIMAIASVNAAEFQSRDAAFIEQAKSHMITIENWDQAENAASTFPHAYKFTHSYKLDTSGVAPQPLTVSNSLDLSQITVTDIDGTIDVETFLRDRLKNHSMVVVQNNQILHQHFWNNMGPHQPHLAMSVTKSFTSLAAQQAVSQGLLNMNKPVIEYLPFLTGSAWHTATVQDVADMRTSLLLDVPKHQSWDNRMTLAQSYNSDKGAKSYPNGIKDYLALVRLREGKMGDKYTYQCANTEVLGLIVEKVTGKNLAKNYEALLSQIGVNDDVYLMAGHAGDAIASGGLNISTADLARVGQLLINDGKNYQGKQVIDKHFIKQLLQGNDIVRSAWKKSKEAALAHGYYKDQFRVLNIGKHRILAMVGIHGQVVAMDFDSQTVIAMNGGYPQTETPRMAISIFYKVIAAILDEVKS